MARVHLSCSLPLLVTLATLLASGCDDPPKPAAVVVPSAATAEPTPSPIGAKPKVMPELLVDEDGPYLGGTRIKLTDSTGPEKLLKIAKELPINGSPVVLLVDKRAKVTATAAVVAALGEAGAPKIIIKTDGRKDLPKEISVTPESRLGSAPSCSLVAMLLKDFSTAVWPMKGGTARKVRKGLAGPDLSHTAEQLEKDIANCESTTAFFSGDESVAWESTFNLAGTVLTSDRKKKLETLVLLREEPVAGRPIVILKH